MKRDPRDTIARQLVLPQVGAEGQRKLAAARVLVVGCGGLGAPVATYLACAGVGQLHVIDDDVIEASHLNRQMLFGVADLGRKKAEVTAARIAHQLPQCDVTHSCERVVAGAVRAVVRTADVVMDCTDGMPTKFLLNDACVAEDRPLVHGAATAWSGQVLVVPGRLGPCLRCLFEAPPPRGAMPTCRSAGILGAVTGVVGSTMALQAIKLILGVPTLVGRFMALDLLTDTQRTVSFDRRGACAACGDAPHADARHAANYDTDADG